VKAFFKSVLRIATAFLLVIVVVALAVWGFTSWQSYRENVRNAELATPREWPKLKIQSLGLSELSLKTMWRDSLLHYQFKVEKARFETENKKEARRRREWIMVLSDSHGFEVFRHTLRSISEIVNDESEIVGLQATGNTYMSADDYRRADRWTVEWVDQ
jgi:hypothetical protein